MSGFYSLIFYPTALLTVYLLTSTSRTAAARFWLFVLFGCSLALERCIVHLTVSDDCAYVPADEASVSASRIRTEAFISVLTRITLTERNVLEDMACEKIGHAVLRCVACPFRLQISGLQPY